MEGGSLGQRNVKKNYLMKIKKMTMKIKINVYLFISFNKYNILINNFFNFGFDRSTFL